MNSNSKMPHASHQQRKKSSIPLKAAIVLSNTDSQVEVSLFVPLMASIMASFPEAGGWVNLSMTICSGVMIPTILLAGKLCRYFDKKKLLMLGSFLFMCGGLLAMTSQNIWMLFCFRIIEGIGAGFAVPTVPSITAALFDGYERSQVIGLQNAGASAIAFTFNLAAGAIALVNWKLAFLIYLVFVPILILQKRCIPSFAPEREDASEGVPAVNAAGKTRMPALVYVIALMMALYGATAWIFNLKLAVLVVGEIGATSFDIGLANAVQPVVAFAIGLAFARLYRAAGNFTGVISLVAAACAYAVLASAGSVAHVCLGMALMGMSSGLMVPFLINLIAQITPEEHRSMGMSWVMGGMLLGSFLSTGTVAILDALFASDTRAEFWAMAALFVAVGAVVAAVAAVARRRERAVCSERQKRSA